MRGVGDQNRSVGFEVRPFALMESTVRKFPAVLECLAGKTSISRGLTFNLPPGSNGEDIVRAAEAYARSRGWTLIGVDTSANGTVVPKVPSIQTITATINLAPLPSAPEIRSAVWRVPAASTSTTPPSSTRAR